VTAKSRYALFSESRARLDVIRAVRGATYGSFGYPLDVVSRGRFERCQNRFRAANR